MTTEEKIREKMDKWVVEQRNEYFLITTPYLDSHNDYIQVVVEGKVREFLISDDGDTLGNIIQYFSIETIDKIASKYAVMRKESELFVLCSPLEFSSRLEELVSCIKEIIKEVEG